VATFPPGDDGPDEQRRISLLAELGVLDTAPEPGFDALARAAAALTRCPIALVTLIDGERQWFKAHHGIDLVQTPRRWSFCAHAMHTSELVEVPDARSDPRFASNPYVLGAPWVRFYAGQPLVVEGIRIGTLCVIDTRPRELDATSREGLRGLGITVSSLLAERRSRLVSLDQQRRLAEFAMVSGDWLWETDDRHRVVWMSCAYATESAVPEPWVQGEAMADGPVLDDAGEAVEPAVRLHPLLDRQRAFARVVMQCDLAGGAHFLSLSAVCRRDAAGKWCGYRGIARDIGARVEAEQARRVAANVLKALSAQVPGLIFQLLRRPDGHMSFPYVSDKIREVYELDAAQVEADAATAMARCHPEDADRLERSIAESAETLGLWQQSFRVVLPRRGLRVLSGHAQPERLADGGVLWHGLITDITAQVEASERMQALARARAAAEEVAQMRSEFMSRVSHELRTPLNAILGFAQLLHANGASQSGEKTVEAATQIAHAGSHLLSLVNDMLDLSSLEAGRLVLDCLPIELEPLVRRCLTMIEPHARQQGVALAVQADPDTPTVAGDARALRQVMFNLLGNAIKFGGSNAMVRIRIVHHRDEREVGVSVIDQGPGIPAEKMSSLFEPFTRIHSGGAAPVGSGLGLSISRRLVLAMRGRLEVSSEAGQGTTFSMRLPVDGRPEPGDGGNAAVPAAPPPARLGAVAPATVLYIEDEPVNALLMQELFKSLPPHLALVVAGTGREGLQHATALKPQLILLDMNLPDMDGLGVLRRLRAEPRSAGIPVIAVSADALPEQVAIARAAGVEDYWTKPIDLAQVRTRLLERFALERAVPGA